MFFEKGQVITLDNNIDYFVYDKINYNDEMYSLLVNIIDESDSKIVKLTVEDNTEIVVDIEDSELISKLAKIFEENINNFK